MTTDYASGEGESVIQQSFYTPLMISTFVNKRKIINHPMIFDFLFMHIIFQLHYSSIYMTSADVGK